MQEVALYALAGVLALGAYRLRFERAFAVVAFSLLWVPAVLLVPVPDLSAPRVTRIVFLAFALSFARRHQQGEIDATALRPPRLVLAAVFCMLVVGAVGVGLADPQLPPSATMQRWLIFVDQAVMVWIAVVATRVLGPRRVAGTLTAALGVAVAIGVVEYLVDASWSSLFPVTENQPSLLLSPLEQRGGSRVRAAASSAVEFGWVIALLLPLVLQRLVNEVQLRWRFLLLALITSGVVAIAWTRSRSALVAAGVGVVLLLVLSGFRRRLRWPVVAAAVVAGTVLLSSDAFEGIFDLETPPVATERDVRLDRLPGILEEVADVPYDGLGLGGLQNEGYLSPDNGWVLLYADTGVLGLAAYASAILLALASTARALRGRDRELAAAVFAGMLLWVAANAAYDASNLGLSGPLFWLLAGVGAVMAERVEPVRMPMILRAVVGGVAAGCLLASLITPVVAPTHVARNYQFQTLPTRYLAHTSIEYWQSAFSAGATVCDAMDALDRSGGGGGRIDCVEPGRYQRFSGRYSVFSPGIGQMRIEAPSVEELDHLERRVLDVGTGFIHFQLRRTSGDLEGTAAAVRTAPAWVLLSLGLLALFWPRRERRPAGPEVAAVDPDEGAPDEPHHRGERPPEPARHAEATTGA